MLEDKLRLLIVEARFYGEISDALLEGATKAIAAANGRARHGHRSRRAGDPRRHRPGRGGGHRPTGVRYDGYVALGCVIRGETYHFEAVANESAHGLMDLSIGRRLAIGNGILTVENEAQAWARARIAEGDKGGGAARACLEMIALRRRLLGQTR